MDTIEAHFRTLIEHTPIGIRVSRGGVILYANHPYLKMFGFERLDEMTGRRLEPIHIVGGGTQNYLLSQFTADATGRMVITGPVEATAAGNVLMQAVALGHLGSLAEAREVVRRSFEIATFEPRPGPAVEDAYGRVVALVER